MIEWRYFVYLWLKVIKVRCNNLKKWKTNHHAAYAVFQGIRWAKNHFTGPKNPLIGDKNAFFKLPESRFRAKKSKKADVNPSDWVKNDFLNTKTRSKVRKTRFRIVRVVIPHLKIEKSSWKPVGFSWKSFFRSQKLALKREKRGFRSPESRFHAKKSKKLMKTFQIQPIIIFSDPKTCAEARKTSDWVAWVEIVCSEVDRS